MDNWVLTGPKTLVKQAQTETEISPTQVKVKITHVLLSNYDALMYGGDIKVAYPKTVGRMAVGIVTQSGKECYGVKKGARVYLDGTRGCKTCFYCRTGSADKCQDIKIAGKDFDGFLRDFVVCEYTDVAVIPDSVDDLHALCIEYVALAENIFDKLNLSAGNTVEIVGAGFFGCILVQIAQYHKLVPIVVDNNQNNIERLKSCGVFFAFNADDDLSSNILDATGGKLCDGAIYTSCCKLNPSIPARMLARKKDMVLGGFSTVNFTIDTQPLFEKNARILAVSDGYDYTEVAINMLVHGAINLDWFETNILKEYDPAALLTEQLDELNRFGKMTVIKMVL
jgi:threonine dehydrogenase-like Zn-dependent dehydrogenase